MGISIYKDCAELLIEKNISVTPVDDKAAFVREWTSIKHNEILNSTFDKAWRRSNGLGLMVGEVSGIICLDIDILDSDENLVEIKNELESMLPPIYCGVQGSNKKKPARFYTYSGECSEKFNFINCEFLSDGNQKVIPLSIHPETKAAYTWVGRNLYDIDADELPALPDNILNYLRDKNEEFRVESHSKGIDISLTPADGRSSHGSHNYISQKVLRLFYQGIKFEDLVDTALELDREINSGVLYFNCPSRKDFRSDNVRLNAVWFVSEIIYRNIYKRYESDFFKEEIANGFTITIPPKTEKGAEKKIRQHISLYNYLKILSDPWYCPDIKSFQLWDGKKYDVVTEDYIKRFAQKNFKNPACTAISDKQTFLDYAKNEQQMSVKEFMLKDNGLINLKNGMFSLTSERLIKHNKSHKMPYVIDVPLIEQRSAPVWESLLKLITLDRPHMQAAIEEFIGYAISACNYDKFNKLLILDGGGSNGKSTLIRIIQKLIGQDNTSSVSLEAITKERFAGYSLVNKLINFCAEEPKEAFSNTGILKKLTGGDSIMVEEKHKGAFQYSNLAKFIISYNKMPFFPDDSSGMRRRIILIPCQQDFEARPDLKLDKPEAQILKSEQPAVLYRCIKAYLEVQARGHFTQIPEGMTRLDEMIIDSNPVLSFIKEELVVTKSNEDFISNVVMYNKFLEFQGGNTLIKKNSFLKRMRSALYGDVVRESNLRRMGGTVQRGFYGVRYE